MCRPIVVIIVCSSIALWLVACVSIHWAVSSRFIALCTAWLPLVNSQSQVQLTLMKELPVSALQCCSDVVRCSIRIERVSFAPVVNRVRQRYAVPKNWIPFCAPVSWTLWSSAKRGCSWPVCACGPNGVCLSVRGTDGPPAMLLCKCPLVTMNTSADRSTPQRCHGVRLEELWGATVHTTVTRLVYLRQCQCHTVSTYTLRKLFYKQQKQTLSKQYKKPSYI